MSSLFVIQGRDQGRRFELEEAVVRLGRDPTCPIRLHDTEVSRRHAELRQTADGTLWVDLNSANGSFINSLRVDSQILRSGDRVQVGRSLMIFTDTTDTSLEATQRDVDIVGQTGEAAPSRIVSSLKQEAGNQLLSGSSGPSESPWLTRARSNLQVMYHTALAVSHTLDIDQLLERIMELIFDWLDIDRGCILLRDSDTEQLQPKVLRDRRQASSGASQPTTAQSSPNREATGAVDRERLRISRTILDYVCSRQEGVLTSDARDDSRWEPGASIVKQGVREAICVPMQGRYGVVGVIYIDTYTPPGHVLQARSTNRLREEHLKLMIAIGHQAALAIEDTSYYSAMVQAERLAAMGQTIASVSHHVKNILQGIRGGSYLIEEGLKAKDWQVTQRGWAIVEKNQDRISHLVMDMLTFSKHREPELVEADVNAVVGEVLELMQGRARQSHVELIDRRDANVPRALFDPDGIHRAVLNVVSNAIDACASERDRRITSASCPDSESTEAAEATAPPPTEQSVTAHPRQPNNTNERLDQPSAEHRGATPSVTETTAIPDPGEKMTVEVSTGYMPEESKLVVVVRDTGGGISAAQQRTIFNVFVSTKGQHGTGLGLPVSQKILQEHGGDISVESTLGAGSRFVLTWPAGLPAEPDQK